MLRTLHPGCLETVTELKAANSRDREDGMCNHSLHAIPERLTITWINIRNRTLNHSTEAVSLVNCLIYRFQPFRWHIIRHLELTTCHLELTTCHLERSREISPNSPKLHNAGTDLPYRSLIQNCKIIKHLLSHHTGSYYRQCQPSGEMSASAWILEVIPLQRRCQVRMTWTRHGCELVVVS